MVVGWQMEWHLQPYLAELLPADSLLADSLPARRAGARRSMRWVNDGAVVQIFVTLQERLGD